VNEEALAHWGAGAPKTKTLLYREAQCCEKPTAVQSIPWCFSTNEALENSKMDFNFWEEQVCNE